MRLLETRPARTALRTPMVWALVFALIAAPIVIGVSHSPIAIAASGEVIWHSHADEHDAPACESDQNLAEHEHQMAGLVDDPNRALARRTAIATDQRPFEFAGHVREGPRRPPRLS